MLRSCENNVNSLLIDVTDIGTILNEFEIKFALCTNNDVVWEKLVVGALIPDESV